MLYLQASYALGYNLAIEYLADYEKTWMLDSFRAFDASVLAPQGRRLREWLFLEARLLQLPVLGLPLHNTPFLGVTCAVCAAAQCVHSICDMQPHKLGTAACSNICLHLAVCDMVRLDLRALHCAALPW